MNRYEIRCTAAQTKKALELGAPIEYVDRFNENLPCELIEFTDTNGKKKSAEFVIPTAEQMIGFLRNKGIRFHFDDITNFWRIVFNLEIIAKGYSETKELDAIDKALEYLTNNKK